MKIIIVGGGKKVHFLMKSFISQGHHVTMINNDENYCKIMARKHKAVIVHGDGTKPYVLEDAGIYDVDVVIALTPKDPDNLVVCQLAQKVYEVERTFAVVNDPKNIDVFKKLGVDTVISTANIISSLIEQKVFVDEITNLIPIEEGKVAIMEVEVTSGDPICKKKLMEITIPRDAIVGCIIRKGKGVIPRGDTEIQEGDKLVVISLPKVQSEVLMVIKGRLD